MKRPEIHRDLALLVLVVIGFALPFIGQPFHMDDNFYQDMARNARSHPLFPNDTRYVFEGRALPDMASHSHPPGQTLFLALIQKFSGNHEGDEWKYHLFGLIHPLIAVMAMYFLAARFVQRPIWPALALAVAPLFLVMQHNLMPDVPTLASWLAAVAAFLWAVEKNSRTLFGLSAIFQFLAMFCSYQALALTPLLAFYQIRKGKRGAGWFSLALPVAGMTAWFLMNYWHFHRFLLVDTAGYMQSRNPFSAFSLLTKIGGVLGYQGWLLLFPFFLLYVLARALRGRLLWIFALGVVYGTQWAKPNYTIPEKAIFAVGIVTGLFLFIHLCNFGFRAFRRDQRHGEFDAIDAQFLSLWYLGVCFYCVVLLPEGSARYVLPLVPPLLLYFFRTLESTEIVEYRIESPPLLNASMVATGTIVLTLAWGLCLSHADYEFASIYPRAASDVRRIVPEVATFYGGEWGFRYYMGLSGARQVPEDESDVRGASLLVVPSLALPYDIPATLRSMLIPVQTFSYAPSTPLRLLDRSSHAGFYSTGWGLLPFSISNRKLETIEVRQVSFLVDRLPWATRQSAQGIEPWPGYLSLQGASHLAVLLLPGSRIVYPWNMASPLQLRLRIGVSPEAYTVGNDASFKFEVTQRDAQGRVIAQAMRTLAPGKRPEDAEWVPLELRALSATDGAATLELRYFASNAASPAVGAFSEVSLSRPGVTP